MSRVVAYRSQGARTLTTHPDPQVFVETSKESTMEVIGNYQLDGARFEVVRCLGGFRILHHASGVFSVVMPYDEVVRVLIGYQYQPV